MEWKDVRGYEGLYQVSNTGKVRSMVFRNNKITKPRIKELKININNHNRAYVSLYKDGTVKNCIVHRLVAMAFIENPLSLPEVNHIDGNPINNNVENLEWCTMKYNHMHAYQNDLNGWKSYNERNTLQGLR